MNDMDDGTTEDDLMNVAPKRSRSQFCGAKEFDLNRLELDAMMLRGSGNGGS